MWEIEQVLIIRVAVDRRHEARLNAKRIFKNFRHRSQTVRRARRIADHVHGLRIIFFVIHSDAERTICFVFAGCGNNHFLGTCREVKTCILTLGKEARALEHNIDFEFLVWELCRVLDRCQLGFTVRSDQLITLELDLAHECPVRRIEREEVSESRRIREIIDEHDIQVWVLLENDAEDLASDTAEAVDGDVHKKIVILPYCYIVYC